MRVFRYFIFGAENFWCFSSSVWEVAYGFVANFMAFSNISCILSEVHVFGELLVVERKAPKQVFCQTHFSELILDGIAAGIAQNTNIVLAKGVWANRFRRAAPGFFGLVYLASKVRNGAQVFPGFATPNWWQLSNSTHPKQHIWFRRTLTVIVVRPSLPSVQMGGRKARRVDVAHTEWVPHWSSLRGVLRTFVVKKLRPNSRSLSD